MKFYTELVLLKILQLKNEHLFSAFTRVCMITYFNASIKMSNFKINLDTGVVDKFGASSGAQPINTAKLDVVNQLFRKVDLKVSTVEKPFHLKEEYDGQLTITTPNNAEFNMTAVDAESGDRYYINEQLTYRVPVNKVGTMEKIFISDGEFYLGY